MVNGSGRKRTYDSTGRQAQAEQTRRRILETARRVFAQLGYAGTTMPVVAAEAGVGIQTIYAIFKSKPRLLVALFNYASSRAWEEDVPVPQRAGPQAVGRERDQRRQIQMFAQVVADNLSGAAPVSETMVDAARTEPEIEKILKRLNSQRLQHMGLAVEQIAANGPLREGLDVPAARDIVWALTSPEVFLLLTRDRGWSKEKYSSWLADTLIRVLLR